MIVPLGPRCDVSQRVRHYSSRGLSRSADQPERAAVILGAAREFHRDAGTTMQPDGTESDEAIRGALAAQLDERALAALLDEGCRVGLEQAVGKECRQPERLARSSCGCPTTHATKNLAESLTAVAGR